MNHRMGIGALLAVLSGCAASAATAPPPRVSAPETGTTTTTTNETAARPEGPADPPGTRRVGVGDWSLAVGEDWERHEVGQGGTYGTSLGEAGVVLAAVASDPRPRGAEAEVYAEVVRDLIASLAAAGLVAADTREVSVGGAPGREVIFRPQFAGEQVTTLTRAVVRGTALGQVWCSVPAARAASARRECGPVLGSLRVATPRTAAEGTQVVTRRDASIVVPESWVPEPPSRTNSDENSLSVRADRTPGATLASVDGGALEGTVDEYFRAVITHYRENGGTILRQRTGRSRGERWLEAEVTARVPATIVLQQRVALHGDRLWAVSCAQPESERAAGRDRCGPVLDSFRFVAQ